MMKVFGFKPGMGGIFVAQGNPDEYREAPWVEINKRKPSD